MAVRVHDNHPAIAIKDAILARSGIYLYSRQELIDSGIAPKVDKPFYKVYRPANVIVQGKDKFPFAVVTKEHTDEDTTPANFRDQAGGVVGDSVEVVPLPNGETGLKGKIAFYTKDLAEYYEQGNRETSAQYDQAMVASDSPDFDYVMTDILSVNGIAITRRGRGGSTVRVLDSAQIIDERFGGAKMGKGNLLSVLFGIGKTKDSGFKLSNVIMGSVAKVHTLDAAGLQKEVDTVMAYVKPLGDGEHKEMLIGAVADSFKHPVEVLAKKAEVSDFLDRLYLKCQDADEKAAQELLANVKDAKGEEKCDCGKADCAICGKKKAETKDGASSAKEGEGKEKVPAKDTATIIDEAVEKALVKMKDSMEGMVDASVKKALGLTEKTNGAGSGAPIAAHTADAASELDDMDFGFVFQGNFGKR